MANIWFIADTHFQHQKIISFEKENRPFQTIEEHDEQLIKNWNKTVHNKDKVFVLGDFAFKDISIADRLNGRKTLIMGNHDLKRPSEYAKYFTSLYGMLKYKDFLLTHAPVYDDGYVLRGHFNCHGHVHSKVKIEDYRYINVSADVINLTPVSYDYLLGIKKEREEKIEGDLNSLIDKREVCSPKKIVFPEQPTRGKAVEKLFMPPKFFKFKKPKTVKNRYYDVVPPPTPPKTVIVKEGNVPLKIRIVREDKTRGEE